MKTEHKIKIIERFDGYYSGINNKGAFILALNTLIISGFLVGYKDIKSIIEPDVISCFEIIIGLAMLLSIASMLYTISAIIPYLKSNDKSLWFFNDIANMDFENFKTEIQKQTKKTMKDDIDNQIYYLANGLKKKHRKIRIALIFNFIQMFLIGIITCIILT